MGDTRRSKAVVNRSELVARLALAAPQLSLRDVELAVTTLLAHMTEALASGQRIELRGFGCFSRHYHAPRVGRNPRTGEPVAVPGKYVVRFKPGKAVREQINGGHAAGADSNRAPQDTDPGRLGGARNQDGPHGSPVKAPAT